MEPTTAIIVDDEELCRTSLTALLKRKHPNVQLLGTADCAADGIKLLKAVKPQLLFLDVDLGDGTGFDVLNSVDEPPRTIFTTAHSQHAIRAFRLSAVDYLLKPIVPAELDAAMAKVAGPAAETQKKEQLDTATQNSGGARRIALPEERGFEIVDLDAIIHCQSDSNYTKVFLRDKRMLLVCRTLKDIGALLDEPRFFRVHDSHIVNMDHTTRYIRGDGGELILDNGQNVPVSRSKKEELMGRLNKA